MSGRKHPRPAPPGAKPAPPPAPPAPRRAVSLSLSDLPGWFGGARSQPIGDVSRAVSRPKRGGKVHRPTLTISGPYTGPVWRAVVLGIPRSGKNSGQNGVTFDGRPIRRKSPAAAAWLASAVSQLVDQLRVAPLIRGRCRVTVHVFHALPLTGWDSDNVVNLALDAMKKALLVADDCAAIVRETETATDVDKSRPRVEITVGPCQRAYDAEGNTLWK